jgi:hypothetical protein
MSEQKLTRRQAAILGAFTGTLCGPFEDMHGYVDSLPGFEGIMTLGLAHSADKIKEAAKADFIAMCPTRDDPK